jgi:hypothetical protein
MDNIAAPSHVIDRVSGTDVVPGPQLRQRGFLEFNQVVPYAHGGEATADNIHLACRAHNQLAAEDVFGPRDLFIRERPGRVPRPPVGAPREAGAAGGDEVRTE